MSGTDLEAILSQAEPPDADTWQRLREALRTYQTQAQGNRDFFDQVRELFHAYSIPQCLTNLDGVIVDINARACELSGFTRDELLGQQVLDLAVYSTPEQRAQLLEQFMRAGHLRDIEVESRRKDGQRIVAIMNWDLLISRGRQFILTTLYDVTAIRDSEEQLRNMHQIATRQAQESALLHEARTILSRSMDLPTLIRAIVDGVAEKFGYTLVSLYLVEDQVLKLQHHHGYVVTLGDLPLDRGIMARAVRLKHPLLLRDVSTDPEFIQAIAGVRSEIAAPLFVDDDAVGVLNVESTGNLELGDADLRLIVALSEHISLAIQRAQLFSSLADSERREREQRLFAEALRDVAAGLNGTLPLEPMIDLIMGHLQRVMPLFDGLRMLFIHGERGRVAVQRGYPAGSFAGTFPLSEIQCISDMLTKRQVCLYQDAPAPYDWAQGTPLASVRSLIGAPIMADGHVIGVLFLDSQAPNTFAEKHADLLQAFADQTGIALKKAQLHKRLRRQNRMRLHQAMQYERRVSEMRAQFGIAISHEFRTPLTTIHTAADLLRLYDERLTAERRRELLGKVKTQIKHLTHLLDDIMLLSRAELIGIQINRKAVDLDQLCRDITSEIQWIAGDKHRILFFGDGLCQEAYIDEDLIRRILINLLTNAVKYSPEGGKVLFILNRETDDAIIEITDNGIGIPAEEVDNLFQTFHRAGNVGSIPGTGLGLTLVKQAVEMHGGAIQVTSTEGMGTTFTVRLPIAPPPT
ncbi:MAG: GAF domain-containing protein [Chloroflexi bacterium]|uniref:PAS domain-containing sensor histidine kinase n=1 Tax=Candidatus Flexifilum breve TaxID=3140694 RepID=UPI0031355C5D|nr:GAF domain-containing protein [Chloroflexota bacterium]